MKKNSTFFMLFLATFIFILNDVAVGQTLTDTWSNNPAWNNSSYYRGFAYGNNRIYVGGRPGGTASVEVMNALTGEFIKSLDNSGIQDLTFDLSDAEYSEDGSILAAPLTLDASVGAGWGKGHFTVYRWKDENSTPEPFVVYKGSGRVDMFTVAGDGSKNGVIMGGISTTSTVWRYIITDGVIGDVEEITIDANITTGSIAVAYPAGLTAADGFWYNNTATNPILCAADGSIVDSIPAALFEGVNGQIKAFSANSKDYVVVVDAGKAKLFDITGKNAKDLTTADIVYTSQGVYDINQDIAYRVGGDGAISVFSFSANNGIYTGSTEAAPVATDLALTGLTLVDQESQINYTYSDINMDAEAATEIKWYLSDDADGTNKTEITSDEGDTTYIFVEDNINKYISFTVLPVAATGTVKDSSNLVESLLYGPIAPADAKAPVAIIDTVKGDVQVDEVLTVEYTYFDENGDLEGESILKWYRADNEFGANKVEVASDTLMYKLLPEDGNKYIIFSVTPVAQTGVLLNGETVIKVSETAVFFPAFVPRAKNVTIAGIEEVTRTLTGSYDYEDLNGDEEGATVLTWYRADTEDGVKTAVATDTSMYKLVADDETKYVFLGVKPVTVDGEEGVEVFANTGEIQPTPPEEPPVASNVKVSGNPEVGAVLSGAYSYFDYTDDTEGETIFKWYTADDAAGTNATLIADANKQTLLVKEAQLGKFIIFEVTPVATSGGVLVGIPVSDTTSTATVPSSREFGLERMWLASTKTGAAPFYINPSVTTERGFAIGEEHIYIASRYGGVKVIIVDKEDGSYAGELSTAGIAGGVYAINDVEVSDDGQILAAPLAFGTDFWIYKWEDESSEPVKWLEATVSEEDGGRFGDKFSVTGDLTGDAIIMAAVSGKSKIVRWVITGGIVGEVEVINLAGEPVTGSSPAAVPFSTSASANILVDGKGFAPTIYTSTGDFVGTIAMIDNYGEYKIQSNSPNVFTVNGRTLAAFFQAMRKEPLGARIIIADITSEPYQIVDSTEYVSNSMAWDGYLGEVDVTVDGDFYDAYMLQAKNAVARYRGKIELPTLVSANTNEEGTEVYAKFTKTLDTTSVTSAANWIIKADDTVVEIVSISADNSIISFTLANALAAGQVATIEYDGNGGVAAFDGTLLEAFGPEAITINIGIPPVALNVDITGDVRVNVELTGTYDFTDADGDLEGESEYQWYYASNADGSDKLKLIGETNLTYTVTSDMENKYISFEVTPVSVTGGDNYLVGEPVMSEYKIATDIEETFAGNLNVYPNPVNDVLTIDNCTEVTTIKVFDITGRVLSVLQNSGNNKLNIDVSSWNSGVFLIQLSNDKGQTKVERIIKN